VIKKEVWTGRRIEENLAEKLEKNANRKIQHQEDNPF